MADIPTSVVSKALAPIVGGVGKELSGLIGDQIRLFRWKNAVRILERAGQFANEHSIPPCQVPLVRSTKDARDLQTLYDRFNKDEFFSEDGFDPAGENFNDIDQVRTDLRFFVSKICQDALRYFSKEGASLKLFETKWERRISPALRGLSSRVDVMPIGLSMNFYYDEEWLNGYSNSIAVKGIDLGSIKSYTNLALFERFEAVIDVHDQADSAKKVRLNLSLVCLSSIGFGFMQACCRASKRAKRSRSKTASHRKR